MPHGSALRSAPPLVRRMLVGNAIAAIGHGLTLPFLVIYLGQVRGLGTATAGLLVAAMAAVALAASAVVGILVDRYGPRPVLMAGMALLTFGTGMLALVTSLPQAAGVVVVVAIGQACFWAPQSSLYARLTPSADRQQVFGLQFMLLNLGLGIGGLVAATMVDTAEPATFQKLYLLDAATHLAYLGILATMGSAGVGPARVGPAEPHHRSSGIGGYRVVLADRALRRLALGALVLLTFGYGSLEVGLPTYVSLVGGLDASFVAIAYVANTSVIVVAQLFVIKRIAGRSRSRLAGAVGVSWAVAWLLVGLAIDFPAAIAAGVICVGVSIFALGETVWSPVFPAIVNDLASDELRGRYNAVVSWTWSVAGMAGPALAALLLGTGWPQLWIGAVVAGCLLAGALLLRMRPLLSPAQDGRR